VRSVVRHDEERVLARADEMTAKPTMSGFGQKASATEMEQSVRTCPAEARRLSARRAAGEALHKFQRQPLR